MAKKTESEIKSIIEAMLFATDQPLSSTKLAQLIGGVDGRAVRKLVEQLRQEYDDQGRAFQIEEIAEGFQILSRQEYRNHVRKLRRASMEARLSQASLDTLAIVAYKQPILRADIEAIRGVQSGPLLRGLMEKNLVKIVGRANVLGRPLLYGTTKKFLNYFNLKSLKDLPQLSELGIS